MVLLLLFKGVVLAVEKRVSSALIESNSVEKLIEIDRHVACALSGLIADARTIVDHARVEAQVNQSLINIDKRTIGLHSTKT